MGMSLPAAELLLRLNEKCPLKGDVVQLGKQDIFIKRSEINILYRNRGGVALDTSDDYMSDVEFFNIIGFSNVFSVDVSDYEDPTHIFDMNSSHLPAGMSGIADFVVDGGTMEHVMDTMAFLGNIHGILKTGGYIIHNNPINAMINHGYFQFSPCFYHDYYAANGYEIVMHYIHSQKVTDHWRRGPFQLIDLGKGYGQNDYGSADRLGSFFVAKKTPLSTSGKTPALQSMYQQMMPGRLQAKQNYVDGMKTRVRTVIERSG